MRICSFFFTFFVILMVCCYSATAESYRPIANANLSTTWTTNYSYDQPMLLRTANVAQFACGFFTEDDDHDEPTSYFFGILISPTEGSWIESGIEIWSANQGHQLKENALLNFTAAGDLVLSDADGSIVWSTNTSGKAVAGMNLTHTGNLVLLDDHNSVVWQSFDHPTDCLVPGQKLLQGQKLKSSVFLTGPNGSYSLQVMGEGLVAYVESNPTQPYLITHGDELNALYSYINFLNGVVETPHTSSPHYFKLMPDGQLEVFEWQSDSLEWKVVDDLTLDFEGCDYPLPCGRNSICSGDKQCSCFVTEYFRPVNDRQPILGCSAITPLTCNSIQNQHFLTLRNISYFTAYTPTAPDLTRVNMETCKQACLKNCSCKAAFFQYQLNASSGECVLPSDIYTMQTVEPLYYHALC